MAENRVGKRCFHRSVLAIALLALAMVLSPLALAAPSREGQAGTTLSATVSGVGHWTRTFHWTIDKSADRTTVTPDGAIPSPVQYTITLTKDEGTDSAYFDGEVCVTNGGGVATENLAIAVDLFDGEEPPKTLIASATVDVSGNPVLDPGETGCYSYRVNVPAGNVHGGHTYKVTAHVTITNHSGYLGTPFGPDPSWSGTLQASPTLVNASVHVDDTNGGSWLFSGSGQETYQETFACSGTSGTKGNAGGTYPNTATIRETGQSDSITVTVNCGLATATPTATTEPTATPTATTEPTATPTLPPEPRVEVLKGTDRRHARPGEAVMYVLDWKSTGTAPATNVTIVDRVPSNTTFWYGSRGVIYSASTRTVRWNLGDLQPGEEGSVWFRVKVKPGTPPRTVFCNDFTLSATNLDPVKSNQVCTTVLEDCGAIGDYVWLDSDGDGIQDSTEHGLPGIHVRLLTPQGELLDEAVTDAAGKYIFQCLKAGRYEVVVNAADPALPANLSLSTRGWYVVNLANGQRYLDADFGFAPQPGGSCNCPNYTLFESDRNVQNEVFGLVPGGGVTALTPNQGPALEPARSPDALWIAYQRQVGAYIQIYLASTDGMVWQRVTRVQADTQDPQWAPECGAHRLAYQSNAGGHWNIRVFDLGTLNDVALTENAGDNVNPNWSPDGRYIAFESNRDGTWQLYVMNTDGTNQTRLVTSSANDRNPRWAPDGTALAFESDRDGRWQIYVLDMTTSQLTNVSTGPEQDVNPAWSPDSTQLAYQSSRCGQWDVYIVGRDGSGQKPLAADPTYDEQAPDWTCDGTALVYQANPNGNWDIYQIAADGTNPQRLTNDAARDALPLWCSRENDDARPFAPYAPAAGIGGAVRIPRLR